MKKRFLSIIIFFYIITITSMISSWAVLNIQEGGNKIDEEFSEPIIEFARFPTKIYHFLQALFDVKRKYNDERFIYNDEFKDGLSYIVDKSKISTGYFLVSTFNEDLDIKIRLLNLKNNTLQKEWLLSSDTILKYDTNNLVKERIRLRHPLMLKDSSLIVNSEDGKLFKFSKSGDVLWVSPYHIHHSIELGSDSTIFSSGWLTNQVDYRFSKRDSLIDDAIFEINILDGRVIYKKSIVDILKENGYEYLLEVGLWENDAIHLNDVEPAKYDTKYWKKGDLLLSLKHKNTILLYRPKEDRVIWIKTGPWVNQHDCDFISDNEIMIFGNDIIRTTSGEYFKNGVNNIYVYNFANDSIITPYSAMMRNLKITTKSEGRCDLLPNGDIFVDETNNGKVYVFNKNELKVTFSERINEKFIKMLNWVRFIPQTE